MKTGNKRLVFTFMMAAVLSASAGSLTVNAAENKEQVFETGVSIENIDLSGMTKSEAEAAVQAYIQNLDGKIITFDMMDNQIAVQASEFGISIGNPYILEDAIDLGKSGNIVKRYKEMKDLENEPVNYRLELQIDEEMTREVLEEKCAVYNEEAKQAGIVKNGDKFEIQEGTPGLVLDTEESLSAFEAFIASEWNREDAEFKLAVQVEEPEAKTDDLAKVKDIIGSFSTSYKTSSASRSQNVSNGTNLINGMVLYPGETFSAYDAITPFTKENGYEMAGSYLNGQVVDSLGGGICQVTSTLYNAVLRAELQVEERHNHSMVVSYVDPSADAAISGTAKDFKFTNNLEYPVYIEGYTTAAKEVGFNIYGVETRDTVNRTVEYESVTLSTKDPGPDRLVADASRPVGYVSRQSAHRGSTAELYKVVKENGVEVSRERINKSTYQASPGFVTVGTATADPAAAAAISNAIASGNADTARAVAGAYSGADIFAQQAAAQAAAEQAAAAQAAAAQAAADAAAAQAAADAAAAAQQ